MNRSRLTRVFVSFVSTENGNTFTGDGILEVRNKLITQKHIEIIRDYFIHELNASDITILNLKVIN
jgi:hypothetical protein